MASQDTLDIWQHHYDLLFRTTSDGALVVDDNGILVRINPAAAAMLRCSPEDGLGKHVASVFKGQPVLIALLTGSGGNTPRVQLPDKRVALGISESQADGGLLVLLRDVTERDELDSRREQLIRTIAHDLRNPLSAIEGFNDLITMYGPLTADQQKFSGRIRQTANKLQNMVESLVDLTWVESGMPMSSVPVYLDKVIAEVAEELADDAEQKQIAIAVSTQQPMPVIMGDPMRLKQVVVNLVRNAIQYSPPERSIAIHAFEDGREVRCSVADRGIGIPEHELNQVFDRLYRVSDEAVRAVPGGGIGLTMAKAILTRHGGTIHVESVYGQGSTFIFTLPIA